MPAAQELDSRQRFINKVASNPFSHDLERFGRLVTGNNVDALLPITLTNLSGSELPPTVIDFINAAVEFNTGSGLAIAVGHPRGDFVQRTLALQVRNGTELVSEVQLCDDPDTTIVHFNSFYSRNNLHSYKERDAQGVAHQLLNPDSKQNDSVHLDMARQILAFAQKEFVKSS